MVEVLLGAAADVDACDDMNWTALHSAAEGSHFEVQPSDSSIRHTVSQLVISAGRERLHKHDKALM